MHENKLLHEKLWASEGQRTDKLLALYTESLLFADKTDIARIYQYIKDNPTHSEIEYASKRARQVETRN
jgi:hypothetical protein